MKPTNLKSDGCVPMSSNCVIWQGPDIECISLCKGDTITDVVYKLATELCTLMDTFNISNYDLTCFNLAQCAPEDFTALINLLIEHICALENATPTLSTSTTGCPDCVVNICSQFYYTNELGDLVTTMQLRDYVLAIGNRVCTIIGQITTINTTLADHEDRITDLENAPVPTYVLPTLTPVCIGPDPLTLDVFTAALEQVFCDLQVHTGDPVTIMTAINHSIAGLSTMNKLCGSGLMNSIPGWVSTPSSMAQSLQNLWLTVADMRCVIQNILLNCCNTDCNAIDIVLGGSLSSPTDLVLTFGGSIPNNWQDAPGGSTIEITDAIGGTETINGVILKAGYYNAANPYFRTLVTANGAYNLTIKVTYRFYDPVADATCEGISQLLILGANTCPTLVLTPGYTNLAITFAWTGITPNTVVMELWNAIGTVKLQDHSLTIVGPAPTDSFVGLIEGTTYMVRIIIEGIPCSFTNVTTLAHPCVGPGLLPPSIDYTNPEGSTNGSTITDWIAIYNAAHPIP